MHKKKFADKNIDMEHENNKNLINSAYQSAKQISNSIDNFLVDIKNEKFQKILLENLTKYDLIIDECKMLMKTYNCCLEDVGFFDKYQNLISLKIANLTKKSTFEIAEILYLTICETNPKLYSLLALNDLDEIDLIKKLLQTNEDFIENLKQFFIL